MAGASAVQVGTANLSSPQMAVEVLDGIEQFMSSKGMPDLRAIIGKARS
jgi:dihydroorotate dehydrogenase (NAD+) catalytic subunit